ncbi:MAG: hypothetical protein L6V95_00330 [Candidatus Melainabacteria bacterium]|nr:MAG: hypothetical protein L6V95_00330 [Candidatus Melainabacteria bacterium]
MFTTKNYNELGFIKLNDDNLTFRRESGDGLKKNVSDLPFYFLNIASSTPYVAYKGNNITSSLSKQFELITDKNELSTEHGEQWVKVKKNDEGKWQYTYQLTDNDSSIIKQTKNLWRKKRI